MPPALVMDLIHRGTQARHDLKTNDIGIYASISGFICRLRQGKQGRHQTSAWVIKRGFLHIIIIQRWLGKLGQPDKWISCLTAAILPPTRREHDEANPPDA